MKYANKKIDQEVFTKINFSGNSFLNTRFTDCSFNGCNLSLVDLSGTRFQDVTFINCKLQGANFSKCNQFIMSFSFEKCLITDCIFSDIQLKGFNFIECNIRDCDFVGSNLVKANFSNSNLDGSNFQDADLSLASFENAYNYRINPNQTKIKGAVFSMPEVVSLLENFDIKIQ